MKMEKVIAVRTGKTIYKNGPTVVKVFDEAYAKSDILNEALNQARVEETGLPIPKILEVSKIEGKWAITSEYIAGKTMAQIMAEEPDRLEQLMDRFVDIQIAIQSKRAPLLNKLKDKMARKISESDLDATARYELHTRLASMPKHDKICHGDFNPSNIICGEDGVDYVLDWSHVTQGNGAADAARTYLLFWLSGDTDKAEMYMNVYCRKTDTAKQYVQKWLPIVAASQSVKGKPEERDLLMTWANVVDYE